MTEGRPVIRICCLAVVGVGLPIRWTEFEGCAVSCLRRSDAIRFGSQCVVPIEYGIEIAYAPVAGHKSVQACTTRPVIEAVMPCLVVDEFRPAT
ncbi:MAG: hypothetical protein ACYST5_23195 [Planctomycetota bacterium]